MQGGGYDSIGRNWENKPFVLAAFFVSELCSGDYPEPVIFRPAGWEQQPCCQGQGAWGTQKGNNLTSRKFRCSGENSESLSTGIKKKKCINCDNPDIGKIAEDQLKRCRTESYKKKANYFLVSYWTIRNFLTFHLLFPTFIWVSSDENPSGQWQNVSIYNLSSFQCNNF